MVVFKISDIQIQKFIIVFKYVLKDKNSPNTAQIFNLKYISIDFAASNYILKYILGSF